MCVLSLRTEVIIYVVERSPNGTCKRIPATTLVSYLEQANIKVQLSQIGVSMSVTRTELSPAQIKHLLQNAPAGNCMRAYFCRPLIDVHQMLVCYLIVLNCN